MTQPDDVLRVVVVDPAEDSRELLRRALLSDEEEIWLEAECQVYDVFLDVVQQSLPDVAIVAIDEDPGMAIQSIQGIAETCPQVNVIATSQNTDGRFILDLIRRGAKEFVSLPLQPEELLEALDRIKASRIPSGGGVAAPSPGKTKGAKVIAFAGARGGVGSTSIAVNMGCILAQNPENRVVMLDLDLVMGDADVCLDIIPDYTLIDVAMSIDRVDLMWLQRALSKHRSGLYLLPHPVKIEDAGSIEDTHVSRIVGLLRRQFTHILLDLSKAYLPTDFAAMEVSDQVLLLIQLEVSSLNNVIRLNESFEERGGLSEKVKVIANRVGSEGEIAIPKAQETIQQDIAFKIPNDARTMFASRNNGVPLFEYAPRSKLFQAIGQMTQALFGDDASGPQAAGGGAGGGSSIFKLFGGGASGAGGSK